MVIVIFDKLAKSHWLVFVIPANAGIHGIISRRQDWTPAFAGVTAFELFYRRINFVLVPNPESRFQRETCERLPISQTFFYSRRNPPFPGLPSE